MPTYRVVKGHDAWARYETIVDAPSPGKAEDIAMSPDFEGLWVEDGISEFDHCQIMEGETTKVPPSEEQLRKQYGTWGEHPKYPLADWQYEVANGDTVIGYWGWVTDRLEDDNAN